MNKGYIYCFSNPSIQNIFMIGSTEKDLETRLNEVNTSNNLPHPTPYVIDIAKKVSNAKLKTQTLHILLDKCTNRTDLVGEFYRITREDIHSFFDLIDGEIWNKTKPESASSFSCKRASIADLIDFTTLQEGSLVKIDGLLVNTNLNGSIGVVNRKVSDNIGIYRIKINDSVCGSKFHLIRLENLTLVL
jgi:hypothetical protein